MLSTSLSAHHSHNATRHSMTQHNTAQQAVPIPQTAAAVGRKAVRKNSPTPPRSVPDRPDLRQHSHTPAAIPHINKHTSQHTYTHGHTHTDTHTLTLNGPMQVADDESSPSPTHTIHKANGTAASSSLRPSMLFQLHQQQLPPSATTPHRSSRLLTAAAAGRERPAPAVQGWPGPCPRRR